MMSISVEASEARDSLRDDKELINTYEVGSSQISDFLSHQHSPSLLLIV